MRYYAKYNDYGKLILIGTGQGGTEITEECYNNLLTEIRSKAFLVDQLYNNEITIYEIPEEWQEEIQRRVNDRISIEEKIQSEEVTPEEVIAALEEIL